MTAAEIARTKVGAWEDLSDEVRADIKIAARRQLTGRLDALEASIRDWIRNGHRVAGHQVALAELDERRARLQRALAAAERLP